MLVFTSCLNPDDIFPLRGTVSTPGQRVALQRAPQATAEACSDDFVDFKQTDADADGGYTFEVFRAQAQSLSTGFSFCFRAATTYASGTEAHVVTQRVDDQVSLPLLPDWHAQLATIYDVELSADGGFVSSANFHVTPIAVWAQGDTAFFARHAVELVGADGVVQWRQGDSVIVDDQLHLQLLPLNADPRITSEFGAVTARATGRYARASQVIDAFNADLRTVWTPTVTATSGDTLFLDGPAQPPPSRGASCDGYDVCPFTDGVLAPAALPDTSVLTLRFPQPLSPTLLVLRGVVTALPGDLMPLPDGVIVSAFSADGGGVGPQPGLGGLLASGTFLHDFDGAPVLRDGGTFEFPPTYLALPLTTAAPVAALRLTTSALRIEEISVW